MVKLFKSKLLLQTPKEWKPGTPYRIVVLSFVGARNTGADVRGHEIVRQRKKIFKSENVQITVTTLDYQSTKDYFEDSKQTTIPFAYHIALGKIVKEHHCIIGAEGAAFQDKFSAAFPIVTGTLLKLASVQQKPSIAYCIDAGKLKPDIKKLIRETCDQSLIIARTRNSQRMIEQDIGLPSHLGADSAFTFHPSPNSKVKEIIEGRLGIKGKKILGIAPMHPFRFPIEFKPFHSLVAPFSKRLKGVQYKNSLFYSDSPEIRKKYQLYLDGIAKSVNKFISQNSDYQPLLIAMHDIDNQACRDLAEKLAVGSKVPIVTSLDYNIFDVVGILHELNLLISTRYHAIITSMPALVPSGGISLGERVDNIMDIRGHKDLLLAVDEEQLEEKTYRLLCKLVDDQQRIQEGIKEAMRGQLKLFGVAGK